MSVGEPSARVTALPAVGHHRLLEAGDRLGVRTRCPVERRHHPARLPWRDLEHEAAGEQEILTEVQAAVELLQVLHVVVPSRSCREAFARMVEEERRQPGIGLQREAAHAGPHRLGHRGVRPVVAVSERVVVAEGEQRVDAQPDRPVAPVDHHHRLLPGDQEQPPLESEVAQREPPGGAGIEPELLQQLEAPWIERARVLVGGKRCLATRSEHGLLQPGEQHHPVDRRPQRGHQEAVVAAGVRSRHRAHGKGARPVRLQPFQVRRACVLPARLAPDDERRKGGRDRAGADVGSGLHSGFTSQKALITPLPPLRASNSSRKHLGPR